MTPNEVAAKLQHFNDWRRGHHDDTAQPDPREIGEAIDAAIEMIERLEAVERERDALLTAVRHEADCVEAAMAEIKSLRAKIEAMEKQEPAAWYYTTNDAWDCYSREKPPEDATDVDSLRPLYLAPGAHPAPSVPDDIMRDAMRYRFLRAARSIPISTQAARDPVVYDEAIDRAMLAVAPETKP